MVMFVTLALLLFSGYPVAFILGGLSMLFGVLGFFLESFSLIRVLQLHSPHLGPGRRETWCWSRFRRSCSWAS